MPLSLAGIWALYGQDMIVDCSDIHLLDPEPVAQGWRNKTHKSAASIVPPVHATKEKQTISASCSLIP